MTYTKEWAESLGIDSQDILPPAEGIFEPYKRTAHEIARRTVIIHAVAAVGYGIKREPVVEWLNSINLWDEVSYLEKEFLLSRKPARFLDADRKGTQWLQEAEWALLWTINKIESLGLPTKTCDTIRIIDEIMPVPGTDIDSYISSAELRPVSEIRAEDERITKLFQHAQEASRKGELPDDLIYGVLQQRHYAFRWLKSDKKWDEPE